jgi:hypothetical protein
VELRILAVAGPLLAVPVPSVKGQVADKLEKRFSVYKASGGSRRISHKPGGRIADANRIPRRTRLGVIPSPRLAGFV